MNSDEAYEILEEFSKTSKSDIYDANKAKIKEALEIVLGHSIVHLIRNDIPVSITDIQTDLNYAIDNLSTFK